MIKQITNLTNSAPATILTPDVYTKVISIQNNGLGAVRLSFDGGSGFTDPTYQATGTDPTPTMGYLLAAGNEWTHLINPIGRDQVDPGAHNPITAILVTSTGTTLDIVTDDHRAF